VSSPGSAPPIEVELRPSRRVAAFLSLTHAAALAAAASLALGPELRAALAATVLTGYIVSFRRLVLGIGPGALRRVRWTADGRWQVRDGAGHEHEATLVGRPVVSDWLTVLRLRGADGRERPLLLCADSADAEALRKLRVRLRFG
jgi:toxin CptA